MKILTSNFLTCAIKSCHTRPPKAPPPPTSTSTSTRSASSSSAPSTASPILHFRDAELVHKPQPFNGPFIRNVLPHLDWERLLITARELGFSTLPLTKPDLPPPPPSTDGDPDDSADGDGDGDGDGDSDVDMVEADADAGTLHLLHRILLESSVQSGVLVCGQCGHEYAIREGIANFLLPSHLV
ncbi:MAG: hypothetical protein M1826_000251 [Phylliscum demangeonii]|nr:MAG: hypothetical protein M1826_000251 [Phylliscum demangeonii]